jgi:hypothetical protein
VSCGKALRIKDTLQIGNFELKYDADGWANGASSELQFTYGSGTNKLLTMGGEAGNSANKPSFLHGPSWTSTSNFTYSSDRNLKKDIVPLWKELMDMVDGRKGFGNNLTPSPSSKGIHLEGSDVHALSVISRLNPVSFKFKNRVESKFNSYGFIAQEVEELLPNLVFDGETGYKALRMKDFISVLTLGLQAADRIVDTFEQEILRVETSWLGSVNKLSSQLDRLGGELEDSEDDTSTRTRRERDDTRRNVGDAGGSGLGAPGGLGLVHNLITRALDDPHVLIVAYDKMIALLVKETARWVFDGADGSVFHGKLSLPPQSLDKNDELNLISSDEMNSELNPQTDLKTSDEFAPAEIKERVQLTGGVHNTLNVQFEHEANDTEQIQRSANSTSDLPWGKETEQRDNSGSDLTKAMRALLWR